jgi:hypothetical protein
MRTGKAAKSQSANLCESRFSIFSLFQFNCIERAGFQEQKNKPVDIISILLSTRLDKMTQFVARLVLGFH